MIGRVHYLLSWVLRRVRIGAGERNVKLLVLFSLIYTVELKILILPAAPLLVYELKLCLKKLLGHVISPVFLFQTLL